MKNIIFVGLFMSIFSCSSLPKYEATVASVDIQKFMGQWYVMAGRFTPFEKDVYNGIESYKYNKEKEKIEISFTYNKGSFDGEEKSIPQTGWVYNQTSKAHWKVSPFWPLKFDYLIIGLADDYSWTVIGVPDQKYVWIMTRDYKISEADIAKIVQAMKDKNYNMDNLVSVQHKH